MEQSRLKENYFRCLVIGEQKAGSRVLCCTETGGGEWRLNSRAVCSGFLPRAGFPEEATQQRLSLEWQADLTSPSLTPTPPTLGCWGEGKSLEFPTFYQALRVSTPWCLGLWQCPVVSEICFFSVMGWSLFHLESRNYFRLHFLVSREAALIYLH